MFVILLKIGKREITVGCTRHGIILNLIYIDSEQPIYFYMPTYLLTILFWAYKLCQPETVLLKNIEGKTFEVNFRNFQDEEWSFEIINLLDTT